MLIPISINLSRNSMHQSTIAERYSQIAKKYGVDPKFLPIEITESTATDTDKIRSTAKKIASFGFPLHMDDFGSEHSSLHTLNIKIVAEGVENEKQLKFLMENGCDQIQGYYFSRPLPEAEFIEKLRICGSTYDPVAAHIYNNNMLSLTGFVEKMLMQQIMPIMPGGFLIYEDTQMQQIVFSNEYMWKLFALSSALTEMLRPEHKSERNMGDIAQSFQLLSIEYETIIS